jgi:hypothetical protein
MDRKITNLVLGLLLVVCSACSEADGFIAMRNSVGSFGGAVGGCPSGTYDFAWNGDHPTSESYACINSGASTQDTSADDGTDRINTNAGQTGKGFEMTSNGQYIRWAVTNEDILDDSICTVCMSVRFEDIDYTTQTFFFESQRNTDNRLNFSLRVSEDLAVFTKGGGAQEQHEGGTDLSDNTWKRICGSWTTATGKISVDDDDGGGWDEDAETNHASWGLVMDELTIGEIDVGGSSTDDVDIDNVFVMVNSYQATDPFP